MVSVENCFAYSLPSLHVAFGYTLFLPRFRLPYSSLAFGYLISPSLSVTLLLPHFRLPYSTLASYLVLLNNRVAFSGQRRQSGLKTGGRGSAFKIWGWSGVSPW